jgi:tetratricopeptide (TPR) repeat protein/2-polyprenyl-3-methyl-5-hydroxy-6-metoxy-1,4-benzoquinol methylase
MTTMSVVQAFQTALDHHQAGRLSQAEAAYRQILRATPDHPDVLHLLGVIAHQTGQDDKALELIARAIDANPLDPVYHNNCGIVLQAQGRSDQAIACFRKALSLKAEYAEANNNLGNALKDQGKLDEAIASYRQALRCKPDYAEAHIHLANVLTSQGHFEEAIACYHEALSFKPLSCEAHYNLGTALERQGELDRATESYRKAVLLEPDFAEAHGNLGNVLQAQGRPLEAAASYRNALSARPDDPAWHYNLGNALRDLGELAEAAASYRTALSLAPNYADAHCNLGIVLQAQGESNQAVISFRRALAIRPDYAEAHNNLGSALNELGEFDAALASYRRALQLKEAPEFKASFARCVQRGKFVQRDADVRRLVIRAVSEPWSRPGDLAKACITLIASDPDIAQCIERASNAWPTRLAREQLFGVAGLAALAKDRLLRALLENAQACDLSMERLLTSVRRCMLDAATEMDVDGVDADELGFYCALARQCFINDYVFATTEEEVERANRLRAKLVDGLRRGNPVPAMWIAGVAAYFPLFSLPAAAALPEAAWPECVTRLLSQQITDPLEEREERARIPRLTLIDGGASSQVQRQYEENPYPRWVKLPPPGTAQTIDSHLRRFFPLAPYHPIDKRGDIDILIAGCGTGQESIEIAQQFPEARVLAVDLSLSSLGYAKVKSSERGLHHIEYAQADILQLEAIGRSFDVISSVGVLHHLADPMTGWQVLASLLRPRGLMLLGLYSEKARQSVVAARRFIAEGGYSANAADIRRCRQDLMSIEDGVRFKPLSMLRDFYGTGECRDLLFHAQEHRFALPQIQEMLGGLGLRFVGFLLEPAVANLYAERYPDDRTMTDLNRWDAFEAEYPDTFAGMYVFWAQLC